MSISLPNVSSVGILESILLKAPRAKSSCETPPRALQPAQLSPEKLLLSGPHYLTPVRLYCHPLGTESCLQFLVSGCLKNGWLSASPESCIHGRGLPADLPGTMRLSGGLRLNGTLSAASLWAYCSETLAVAVPSWQLDSQMHLSITSVSLLFFWSCILFLCTCIIYAVRNPRKEAETVIIIWLGNRKDRQKRLSFHVGGGKIK